MVTHIPQPLEFSIQNLQVNGDTCVDLFQMMYWTSKSPFDPSTYVLKNMYMFRLRNIDYHGQASKLICWKHYHAHNKISKEQSNNDSNSKTSKLAMWNMMVKATNTIYLESHSLGETCHFILCGWDPHIVKNSEEWTTVIDPAKLEDSDDGKVVMWDRVRSATEASQIDKISSCVGSQLL